MLESYLKDRRRRLPCAAYPNGEYGAESSFDGVPIIIGKNGIDPIFFFSNWFLVGNRMYVYI